MKKLLLPILLLCMGYLRAQEKESLTLSLDQAIKYAQEHNRSAINAGHDIEAAKKQKWETTATGLPQINGTADYQSWINQQLQPIPSEFTGGDPGGINAVAFGPKNSLTGTATLTQLIFDGSYLVGLQSAKVYLQISENAKTKTDLEVKKAVIDAYGNVLMAEENITILESNIAVLEKNLFETDQMFKNGLSEEENVEQLQITLSQTKIAQSNAERMKDIAYKMLNLTLGADISTKLTLTEDLEALANKNVDLQLFEAELNVADNIDYQIAENNKVSQELLLKLERSKGLPSLSSFINYGIQSYSSKFTFFQSDQRYYRSSMFGFSLNVPIFSSFAHRAAKQRMQIEVDKAKNDLTETEQQLKFQFEQAQSEYKYAVEQYTTAQQNLDLAERIEHKNQVKYSEGIATSFDLRQAQTQLYTAQQEYLQSMLNVISKKATLETILNN